MDRMLKINELVRQQLGEIINEEVELPSGAILTITRVSVSKDLRHAHVYISAVPDELEKKVFSILVNERKNIQSVLSDRVVLRNTPQIQFELDESEQKAAKLDELLDNLK